MSLSLASHLRRLLFPRKLTYEAGQVGLRFQDVHVDILSLTVTLFIGFALATNLVPRSLVDEAEGEISGKVTGFPSSEYVVYATAYVYRELYGKITERKKNCLNNYLN